MSAQEDFRNEQVLEAFATVGRVFGQILLQMAAPGARELPAPAGGGAQPAAEPEPPGKALLNRTHAAAFFDVSLSTFDEWRRKYRNELGEKLVDGRPMFLRRKLEKFAEGL